MTREDEFDQFYENQDSYKSICFDCGRCTREKREHCEIPKKFVDRYGFNNYKEMIECES